MKNIKRFQRLSIVILLIISCILILTNCINNQAEKVNITNFNGERFAGSSTCRNCHQAIFDSFLLAPHYLTSRPATKQYIKGDFDKGKNTFFYNYYDQIVLEDRDSGLFQAEYYHGVEKKAHRFDIVIGSGTRGQTYLYWQGNQLYQLPVSYFTPAHTWSNSPGNPKYEPFFGRSISEHCLGCHSTYFKVISTKSGVKEFDHKQIIYGVDCERCHGPAAKHVEYQLQHPKEKQGKFIINPAAFTRQQKLDMCALCHSGIWNMNKSAFSFMAGDTLSKFISSRNKSLTDTSNIDVHGNEYGLLIASKCYKMTNTLQCNTCHNTHINQRGNLALFSQKCMTCHNNEHGNFCKMATTLGASIVEDCISCHMPVMASKVLTVQLQGQLNPIPAMIRKHYISIYPEATKKFLAQYQFKQYKDLRK